MEIEIENRHLKKIEVLMSKVDLRPRETVGPVPFWSLSSRNITDLERSALELGPKYIFAKKPNFRTLIPQIENILKNVEIENRNIVRAEIAVQMVKFTKRDDVSQSEVKTLMKLRKDDSINIVKSDKSNKIVIIDSTQYDEEMH